ncbi:MAG: hypothetical protein ACTHOO_02020 [Alcanivorax sp.]
MFEEEHEEYLADLEDEHDDVWAIDFDPEKTESDSDTTTFIDISAIDMDKVYV